VSLNASQGEPQEAIPSWKQFEELVAKIHKHLAPDAIVRTHQFLPSKSGEPREFDITITQQVGLFNMLTVIECKYHKRPVNPEKVDAFVTKLGDVGASRGAIVSRSGFQRGAKRTAALHNVALLTYHEAVNADWSHFLIVDLHAKVSELRLKDAHCVAILGTEMTRVRITTPIETPLYDQQGREVSTIEDHFWWGWVYRPSDDPLLGHVNLQFIEDPPKRDAAAYLFLKQGTRLVRFMGAQVTGCVHADIHEAPLNTKYEVVLSDDQLGAVYQRCTTQIDIAAIRENYQPRDMTSEEYMELKRNFHLNKEASKPLEYIIEYFSDRSR